MPPRRQCNRQALHPFEPQAANVNPFLLGVKGGYSLSEEREYPLLVLRRARRIFPPRSARKATAPLRERKKEAALSGCHFFTFHK